MVGRTMKRSNNTLNEKGNGSFSFAIGFDKKKNLIYVYSVYLQVISNTLKNSNH